MPALNLLKRVIDLCRLASFFGTEYRSMAPLSVRIGQVDLSPLAIIKIHDGLICRKVEDSVCLRTAGVSALT
jgi:hypothetical protein